MRDSSDACDGAVVEVERREVSSSMLHSGITCYIVFFLFYLVFTLYLFNVRFIQFNVNFHHFDTFVICRPIAYIHCVPKK